MKLLACVTLIFATPAWAAVSVSSPIADRTVSSPVHFAASATTRCARGIAAMGIYTEPDVLSYKVSDSRLNADLILAPGRHTVVVEEWDRCGGTSKSAVAVTVAPAARAASVPASSHVFLIVEENHSYSSVMGNPSMPYLNRLARRYGVATEYYANTHPSIGNYFMLTTGEIITNDDSFCGKVEEDNLVRQLLAAGKTWKAYAESLPSVGYTGCGGSAYVKRHNPFAYFSDVADSVERYNLVPFTQFPSDLSDHTLPDFSYIVPNVFNDAHSGSLGAADAWLKANIAPLVDSDTFQQNSLLIIVFDESFDSDTQHGGGHIPAIVIGPKVKPGSKSSDFYQHQNTLKTILKALGLTSSAGKAAGAAAMDGFF
jgi:acid phosphatase